MVLRARYRLLVRVSLGRPPGFGNHSGLSTGSLRDLLDPATDEFAGVFGKSISVEEGVAIDCAEVGRMA